MKQNVSTSDAPVPMGPFSQALRSGNLVFVSAQLAMEVSEGKLMIDNISEETKQVMKNIGAILTSAGLGFEDVVKCSVFLKDMNDYKLMNDVYRTYFREPFPARETIQVAGLPADVNVEISAIAMMTH